MSLETAVAHPRTNLHLLGQQAAEKRLLDAFRSGRLPHAWLVTGPRGIGKATLAYRFARFLLSPDEERGGGGLFDDAAESLDVSADIDAVRLIATTSHPDLRVLQLEQDEAGKPRQAISVESVRAALAFVHLTPALGGWRIIIVDAADDLNRNAANALLKALEEPPRNTIFLLVSHAPGRLMRTIRSRCCHLVLPPLPEATVRDLLGSIKADLPEEEVLSLARLAEGSIGRALDLAGQGGLTLYKDLLELLSTLPRADLARLQGFADRLARDQSGTAYRTASDLLLWWLVRLARSAASGALPTEIVPGEAALMSRLGGQGGLAQIAGLWEKMNSLFGRSEAVNLDRRQVFISAFLELESLAI